MSTYSLRGNGHGSGRGHLRILRDVGPAEPAGPPAPAISAELGHDRLMTPGELDLPSLFRQHHAELVRLALLLTGDRPAAEDAVQDVFTTLHARRDRLRPTGDPLAYIRACVLNRCRSVLRRSAIARRIASSRPAEFGELQQSAESEALWSEDRRQVLAALAALPRRRREVLVLRYYLDLSEAEIARTLQISPGTVKSNAARGLAALARALGEES
jgi:RNA polymerase sigma-70 factor (sigma-E family)